MRSFWWASVYPVGVAKRVTGEHMSVIVPEPPM
jgi:hypothetical protein